jgi:FAD/FMN-containing dehydrogenase
MLDVKASDRQPLSERAIGALRQQMQGPVLTPQDDAYDAARQIWNAMIDRRPAVIARCVSSGDLQAAVRFARERELLVSIRAGGHNIAGLALCDGGLTIDLSLMKEMTVDRGRRTVVARPGLTWGEFDRETQRYGLATTGGAVSTTGIAGLTLGGGIGWLMGRCGYSVDNLLSAEVVLHDGEIVTASETEHSDLFWGLRGGGGNFGVVTSFEYQLHQVGPVWAGLVAHPIDRLTSVLRFYREFVSAAPDELTVHAAVMTLPTGETVVALLPVWSGDPAEGERRLAPLRAFGPPIADMIQQMPYVAAQSMLDAAVPYGRHNYWKSTFLRELDDDAARIVEMYARRITSPYSLCLIEHVHGAATRRAADATAFGMRDEHFHFVAIASWDPAHDRGRHVEWAREFYTAMQPWTAKQVYVNILGQDESDRIAEAYGANYGRLAQVKARYDPSNVFRVNQNIAPVSTPAT